MLLIVSAVVSLALAGPLVAPAGATCAGRNGLVVFSVVELDAQKIFSSRVYVVRPDGRGARSLPCTSEPEFACQDFGRSAVSADGRLLAQVSVGPFPPNTAGFYRVVYRTIDGAATTLVPIPP